MADLPLVSCLVPTHNYGQFLGRALDSVMDQDYPQDRLEIVVVDDGSEDHTANVVAGYGSRVRYVRQANAGLRHTINRLLAESSGELLTFLSGDDVWLPGRVRLHVDELLRRPELGLVYGDLRVIDADDELIAPSFWAYKAITPRRGRPLGPLLSGNFVSGGAMMVRASLRSYFDPLPEHAPWEDWWIALRVAAVADIDYLPQPLIGYRRHGANQNLDADANRQARNAAETLPLRHWILTELEAPEVAPQDWLTAHWHWHSTLGWLSGAGYEPGELLPLNPEMAQAARNAARRTGELLAAGELAAATREAVRSHALDPREPLAQRVLETARGALAGTPAQDGLDCRSFVTFAMADELISDPGLLRDYSMAFDGGDDATLLVAVRSDRVTELSQAVAAAGLEDSGAADLVGVPLSDGVGEPWAALSEKLAPAVHAVLSVAAPRGILMAHPRFGAGEALRLRTLADRRWAATAPAPAR